MTVGSPCSILTGRPNAGAPVNARGSRRLDHDKPWPPIRQRHGKMAGHRGCDAPEGQRRKGVRRR